MIASRGAGDLAILGLTSGTTARPRAHAFQPQRDASDAPCHEVLSFHDSEERLVFLPLCHVAERVSAILFAGLGLGDEFRRGPETVPDICARCTHRVFWRCGIMGEFTRASRSAEDATPFQNWMYRQRLRSAIA